MQLKLGDTFLEGIGLEEGFFQKALQTVKAHSSLMSRNLPDLFRGWTCFWVETEAEQRVIAEVGEQSIDFLLHEKRGLNPEGFGQVRDSCSVRHI